MEVVLKVDLLSLLACSLCIFMGLVLLFRVYRKNLQDYVDNSLLAARKAAVSQASAFVTDVIETPEVHAAMCNLISQGISTWVQGEGPEHLEAIVASRHHEKAAREIGKQLPRLVGSISKGVVDSFNPFRNKAPEEEESFSPDEMKRLRKGTEHKKIMYRSLSSPLSGKESSQNHYDPDTVDLNSSMTSFRKSKSIGSRTDEYLFEEAETKTD